MRILGIDPGYDRCGVAVIEKGPGKETLIFSTCIQTNKKESLPERLSQIHHTLSEIISTHTPKEAALERLYFSKNQKTALSVAEARGSILTCIAQHNIHITEYTPNQIKLAVTGYGSADKKQVISMVHRLISIPHTIQHDDEYDAIGVALTHSAHHR